MTLADVIALYDEGIRDEAFRRFGVEPSRAEALEGSTAVYRAPTHAGEVALKIAPGFVPGHPEVMGSTIGQVGAEADFVRACAGAGLPVADIVPSLAGALVEVIPAGGEAAFFAYATALVPGELLPDEDVCVFPEGLVSVWGRGLGELHRFAETWEPAPGRRRLEWSSDDLFDPRWFSGGQLLAREGLGPAIEEAYRSTMAAVEALPRDRGRFGLCHGDPHHGNFMWHEGRFTWFDFDHAFYAPFASDVATALINCLPQPREAFGERRRFALAWLHEFLPAYRGVRPFGAAELASLPLLLKLGELGSYGYCRKYSETEEPSPRRLATIEGYERRLAAGEPVVRFEPGDLEF